MAQRNKRQKLVRLFSRAFDKGDTLNIQGALIVMEMDPALTLKDSKEEAFEKVSNELADVALEILSHHAGPAQTVSPRALEIKNFWEGILFELKAQLTHEVFERVMGVIQPGKSWELDSGDLVEQMGFAIYLRCMQMPGLYDSPRYQEDLGLLTGVSSERFYREIAPLVDIVKLNAKMKFFLDFCPEDDWGERTRRQNIAMWFKNKPWSAGYETMTAALRSASPWMYVSYMRTLGAFIKMDLFAMEGAEIMKDIEER